MDMICLLDSSTSPSAHSEWALSIFHTGSPSPSVDAFHFWIHRKNLTLKYSLASFSWSPQLNKGLPSKCVLLLSSNPQFCCAKSVLLSHLVPGTLSHYHFRTSSLASMFPHYIWWGVGPVWVEGRQTLKAFTGLHWNCRVLFKTTYSWSNNGSGGGQSGDTHTHHVHGHVCLCV